MLSVIVKSYWVRCLELSIAPRIEDHCKLIVDFTVFLLFLFLSNEN